MLFEKVAIRSLFNIFMDMEEPEQYQMTERIFYFYTQEKQDK